MSKIEFKPSAFKDLSKLDRGVQKKIFKFLDALSLHPHPRSLGSPLKGKLGTFWRYRVGDYRIICLIEDQKLVIHVLYIGHRKEIYNIASHK